MEQPGKKCPLAWHHVMFPKIMSKNRWHHKKNDVKLTWPCFFFRAGHFGGKNPSTNRLYLGHKSPTSGLFGGSFLQPLGIHSSPAAFLSRTSWTWVLRQWKQKPTIVDIPWKYLFQNGILTIMAYYKYTLYNLWEGNPHLHKTTKHFAPS